MKKITGTLSTIEDLSNTAREFTFTLPEKIDFVAGNFVNVFMDINGERVRRAYSISSSDAIQDTFSISVRHSPDGVMTPVLWSEDFTGTQFEIMGPLGVNTADKLLSKKAYLFAYGVGAGVIKSVLDHILRKGIATRIVVMTGSRSEDEILHRDYFDGMATQYPYVEVRHIISQPHVEGAYRQGYIQDHIDGIDFNNADVYMCGQKVACDALTEKIKVLNPNACNFFVEAFH